jgi:glycosyltransferase involved in cell wall biosynthesis
VRILYVCADMGIPVLGNKGASVHVREMVAAFCRAGHHVIVAAPTLTKSPWDVPAEIDGQLLHIAPEPALKQTTVAVKTFSAAIGAESPLAGDLRRVLYNQDLLAKLLNQFEDSPPDLIYERLSLFATAGVQLGQTLKRPVFIEMNAPLALEQAAYRGSSLGELARQAEGWVLSNADHVLTVSAPLRNYAIEHGSATERTHVLPNGVDTHAFHAEVDPASDAALRREFGIGAGPVLGFVGGMRPWHDVAILPPLLARLAQRHPGAQLVVVGDGPVRASVTADAQAQGVADRVVFTDWVPHQRVPDLIRTFDIALAPYAHSDHFFYFSPLKLFEYMACGVPVVAADIGQIADVIDDGATGCLYEPGDLDALTARCVMLLNDRVHAARIAAAGAACVAREYTWDRNAERVAGHHARVARALHSQQAVAA